MFFEVIIFSDEHSESTKTQINIIQGINNMNNYNNKTKNCKMSKPKLKGGNLW